MINKMKNELIIIVKNQAITDIRIKDVNNLHKPKPFLEDGTLKINKSQIARELEVDRRTVDKYINGYSKPETRNCDDCITPFYDIIAELLSDKNQQVFYYRKVLWQYLVDNHDIPYYKNRYGKKIRPVIRRSECDIPDDCTCPRCEAPKQLE